MRSKEKIVNAYILLLLPIGLSALVWAIYTFPVEKAGMGLAALSVVTVFFSSSLRIQLPRTKLYLTISDALIFLSLLIYGGEISVLLAVMEAGFTSTILRRQGIDMGYKTIFINVLIAAVSVFATSLIVGYAFTSTDTVLASGDLSLFAALLAVMAVSQFIVNSVFAASFIAVRTERPVWQVWNEHLFNALVMFVSGAVMAGLMAKALQKIDVVLFAAVIAFFALVYMTYRRYIDDVKRTALRAEQAERERAEQAEEHVNDLRHYVAELEKTGNDLLVSREQFRHAAYHDELTGLPNRNQVLDTLRSLIGKGNSDPAQKFAVLFLDLNRFKTINDSLGHSTGDLLIKHVARRLSKLLSPGQMLGRFGGDEFAILLPDFANQKDVIELADKAAKRLAEPFKLGDRSVFTSVSIGIAFGDRNYAEAQEILRDSDIAMYYAKEKQKDFVVFDQKMHARAVTLLQLETDLRFALERNELELFYQPIVGLSETKLAGFEALVRWNHPTRGLISPNEFIPVSEDTGLIIPMTVQILQSACLQLVDWQKRFPSSEPLTVAVNLSGRHFAHPVLVEQIRTTLRETGIAPGCLKLEITESAVMENAENAILMLKQIRELGVQLCIDDFGTGHSSLSYLQRFPIDTLKVDRSFVNAMEDGSENGEIVRTVIALAKILKLNVVAEGIESIHQFHQLRVLGCEFGQGYLFSRPMPVAEIDKMLTDKLRFQNIPLMTEYSSITPTQDFSPLVLPQ